MTTEEKIPKNPATYESPKLLKLGDVRDLTLGTSAGAADSGMNSEDPLGQPGTSKPGQTQPPNPGG